MSKTTPNLLGALCLTLLLLIGPTHGPAKAQGIGTAKYGGEFLSDGIGARAPGMGGAQAAVAGDVSAGFWNPAGLARIARPDLLLMHSERFSGTVAFDVAAIALPLGDSTDAIQPGVLALTLIRQGVDGIPNTLDAWDPDRGLPREDAESYITRFNVTDVMALLSYSTALGHRSRHEPDAQDRGPEILLGGSLKVLRQRIGPFADAWGYGLDIGLMAEAGLWTIGAVLEDATTMIKFWQVDEASLSALETDYGDVMPTGSDEAILPRLRMGAARRIHLGGTELLATADLEMAAENRRAYSWNAGRFSLSPHAGLEASWRKKAYVRVGATDLVLPPGGRATVTPTIGAGLVIGSLRIDYGFSDFSGYASPLGTSHRVSLGVQFR